MLPSWSRWRRGCKIIECKRPVVQFSRPATTALDSIIADHTMYTFLQTTMAKESHFIHERKVECSRETGAKTRYRTS